MFHQAKMYSFKLHIFYNTYTHVTLLKRHIVPLLSYKSVVLQEFRNVCDSLTSRAQVVLLCIDMYAIYTIHNYSVIFCGTSSIVIITVTVLTVTVYI
jgi:hypothetical protein